MKRFASSLIAVAMVAAFAPTAASQSSDEDAVRAAYLEMMDARNRSDAGPT